MFSLRFAKTNLLASVLALLCVGMASLSAADETAIKVFMSTSGDEKLYIVDTNSKKILIYQVNPKGLLLKEVRSFENALKAPDLISTTGLTYKNEAKELAKAATEEAKASK